MLALQTAWRILRAEHARMRELLSAIDAELQSERWRPFARQTSVLRDLVRSLQMFDRVTHRPKGATLLEALRGRCRDADDLLDRLALETQQCDKQMTQILILLDLVDQDGSEQAAVQCTALLHQHRELMLSHLDEEDTVLHSYTARLLTREEWSTVVSSISSVTMNHRRRGPASHHMARRSG